MRTLVIVAAALALAACQRGEEYESSGALDTARDTTDTIARISIPDVDIGTTTDTVNVPSIGTKQDTVVVDRPVITGRKPVEVKRPTVDVNKRP